MVRCKTEELRRARHAVLRLHHLVHSVGVALLLGEAHLADLLPNDRRVHGELELVPLPGCGRRSLLGRLELGLLRCDLLSGSLHLLENKLLLRLSIF